MFLPRIRIGARRLIVAQQMTAGEPPQEITGSSLDLNPAEAEAND